MFRSLQKPSKWLQNVCFLASKENLKLQMRFTKDPVLDDKWKLRKIKPWGVINIVNNQSQPNNHFNFCR